MTTKEAITKKVKDVFQSEFGIAPFAIKPGAHLYKDLDLDSIDAIDLVVRLEVETGLKLKAGELKSIRTFQDVVDVIWKKLQTQKPVPWGMMAPVIQTSRIAKGVSIAAALLALTYPFLVYAGWQRVNPRVFLGGAILLIGLRFWLIGSRVDRSQWKDLALPWLFPAAFLLIAFLFGRRWLFLYWPVVVSAALLFAFGRTLAHPPTLVERFARLQKTSLTNAEIAYCRTVTQLWCLFFIANGGVAWALARGGSLAAWTLYNGLISYFLIGALMASEYVYRHWRFRPPGAVLTTWINRWSH